MKNIDASLPNADWTKRTWDLPTEITYYVYLHGSELKDYVSNLLKLPVANAMPDELREEFKAMFPDLFDVPEEDAKAVAVKTIKDLIEELQRFLESKGVQRHVRDSAYWGAPVGTPLPLPPGFGRSSDLAAAIPSEQLVDRVSKLHPAHTKVKSVKKVPTFDLDIPAGSLFKPFEYTDKKTGVTVTVKFSVTSHIFEVSAKIDDQEIVDKWLFTKDSAFRYAQYQLKKPYIDAMYAKALKSKRKTDGFHDMYAGRYGVDWSEDGPGFISEDDVEGRWAAAIADANELGISYVNGSGAMQIHYESIETINSLARAHEELMPGFSYYAPKYGVRPMPKRGVVAYNTIIARGSYTSRRSNMVFTDPERTYDYTAIGLAKEYFAEDWDEAETYELLKYDDKSWWSVDPRVIAEENGYEDWEGLIFSTVTHELGHTIGRIVFGELSPNDFSDIPYREKLRRDSQERLKEILKEFGVITSYTSNVPLRSDGSPESLYGVDSEILTELLSKYGTHSLHELVAEAWAEYMLASRPRPLAQAIGEMLEDIMKKWIENEFKDA